MPLSEYRREHPSGRSPEPPGRRGRERRGNDAPGFVIQYHAARSDPYDLRLEIDGVLVSWAVLKGASNKPDKPEGSGWRAATRITRWDTRRSRG